jgi:hypothetical protein
MWIDHGAGFASALLIGKDTFACPLRALSFELLRRSGISLSMCPYAREISFGLLKIWYLPLDLFVSSKNSKLPNFELLRSAMSISMGLYAREIGFGLLKIWYLLLDLFLC